MCAAVLGGALKRTTCGRWAHPACALWLPETQLDRDAAHLHLQGLVELTDRHSIQRSIALRLPHEAAAAGKAAGGGGLMTLLTSKT